MKKYFLQKKLGFFCLINAGICALVAFILNIVYGYLSVLALLFIILVVIIETLRLFYDNDWIIIGVGIISTIALGAFITMDEVFGSIVDYANNIVMFGHPENIGMIITIIIFIILSIIFTIISSFITTEKAIIKQS